MSSGVSEKIKLSGNAAKNTEDQRNIPWSQQVDEAYYDNLASPLDEKSAPNSASMKFQYPPFNANENQGGSIYDKNRRIPSHSESNKKYNYDSYSGRDDVKPNAWSTNNGRRIIPDNTGGLNRSNKINDAYLPRRTNGKLNSTNATAEEKKPVSAPVSVAPKKTTWASIASQPAKPTSRAALTTSNHKKKGPGMPPPPMVPGRHNLDMNTWDTPNNNPPPPVPSPPPPPINLAKDLGADDPADLSLERSLLENRGNKANKETRDTSYSGNFKPVQNTNFGRARPSPNGFPNKNWSTQHPLHRPQAQHGATRVGDENAGSSAYQVRSGERRYSYKDSGDEQSNSSYRGYDSRSSFRSTDYNAAKPVEACVETPQAVLEELRVKNNYNPTQLNLDNMAKSRFFVIKSYSEDDIHRSIKYEIWCSTDHGNKRLDDAFKERQREGGQVYLFFSVNASGHFCGIAQMITAVDYNSTSSVWSQDKWKGKFKVKWIYVKDVPNTKLRHIVLENNDNKSVTHSRDTQEVFNAKGIEVLQIFHSFKHSTSIFDDFYHYEKKQEEEVNKKPLAPDNNIGLAQNLSPNSRHYGRQIDDRDRDRDRERDRDNKLMSNNQQRYIGPPNYRDKNNSHRGGYNSSYNSYNDRRKFEIHRNNSSTMGGDYGSRGKNDNNDLMLSNRDNSDLNNDVHADYEHSNRGNDDRHAGERHYGRERDFTDSHNKDTENRLRGHPKETYKDNDNP